jgi:gluconate 2-dehydrogenase gamma chain
MGSPALDTSTQEPPPGLMHLTEAEARTVEAIAARIIPDDPTAPGARRAGVIFYIDRTLAGFEAGLQPFYAAGLKELEQACSDRFGRPFADLPESSQDDVLRTVLGPATAAPQGQAAPSEASDLLAQFVTVVRRHTIEGFFCDPMYGGNRDTVGWKLVGFPGAHWSYSVDDMRLGADPDQIPVKTLADLRAEVRAGLHGTAAVDGEGV